MQKITGTTKLLGVIGDPIEHSLSPVMHNAAIASLGVDYVYLPLPVKPADLENAIAGFKAIGLSRLQYHYPPQTSDYSPVNRGIRYCSICGSCKYCLVYR
jgi:shikimate dehydrogenase